MNVANEYTLETSQKALAAGILQQAAEDLRRFHAASTGVERELYRDAYSWLMADDSSWPFSFLNVCQLLNLVPEVVRDELLGDMSLGVFRYWSRRSQRFARRSKVLLRNFITNERGLNVADPGHVSRSLAIR